MRTIALSQRERLQYMTVLPDIFPQKTNCASRHHTSWCSGILTEKGWSSDFPPLPSAFSPKRAMAFMLRSHNGVHCCGTVGDSHPSSQLIAAKRTFTGDSLQNHDAKVQLFLKSQCVFPVFFTKSLEIFGDLRILEVVHLVHHADSRVDDGESTEGPWSLA